MTEKNTAQTLLAQLTGKLKDSVTINVGGVEFHFIRDNAAYDQMINEIDSKNKITPIKDYLLTIVAAESREALLEVINIPGLAVQIAGKVNEVLVPQIEISVKN